MLTVLEGNNFLVADDLGEVGDASEGLYLNDTRYLSRWRLTVNGERPQLLTSNTIDYYSAAVFMQNVEAADLPAGAISLTRDMFVGAGSMQTRLHIENHTLERVDLALRLEFDFDFLDVFEVKAREYRTEDLVFTLRAPPSVEIERSHDTRENSWSFAHREDGFQAAALVWFSQRGEAGDTSIAHALQIAPGSSWEQRSNVVLLYGEEQRRPSYTSFFFGQGRARVEQSLGSWRQQTPQLHTDWEDLAHAYETSVGDLAALRMRPRGDGGGLRDLPAAGLPWFMTVFGRDTLITSYQTLLLGPTLAGGTLDALADLQAHERDDEADAEPGKIVHEVRMGRVAAAGRSFPYYGSVDSTLLFLILLSEAYRWTGDKETVLRLREPAMQAINWMRTQADLRHDGYVSYHRRSAKGLESQSWKDSWDSMRYRDGTIAQTPISTAEAQGYAFDARIRMAELARSVWRDAALAAELEVEAALLRERFNRDYWTVREDVGGTFVLGLDDEGHQIDSLCSNIGHLLWSGIVEPERAAQVAETLVAPDLYSGWGVRTMSSADRGFNPIGYHTGTVWPHDNSLVVAGLARYGYRQYANRIAQSMIEASSQFDHRLPEVFAGYPRERTPFPVSYPTACSPQAWAAGTPILFLTVMLGLRPDAETGTLKAEPMLPDICSHLELRGVEALGRRFTVRFRGGNADVSEDS